jgi:hypothetical protein
VPILSVAAGASGCWPSSSRFALSMVTGGGKETKRHNGKSVQREFVRHHCYRVWHLHESPQSRESAA